MCDLADPDLIGSPGVVDICAGKRLHTHGDAQEPGFTSGPADFRSKRGSAGPGKESQALSPGYSLV
jgi:hypothetical protein